MDWVEVFCPHCSKDFAIAREYLRVDGCFERAGKEVSVFCPYCRAEALAPGESPDDYELTEEDMESIGWDLYYCSFDEEADA